MGTPPKRRPSHRIQWTCKWLSNRAEGQGFVVELRSSETLSECSERTTRRVRIPCGAGWSGGAGIRTLKPVRAPVFETDLSFPPKSL